MLKVLAIMMTYQFGMQIVQTKGYMPEENFHTPLQKIFNYLKALGGCLLASVIISNWGQYRGITGKTIESFFVLFIPCVAGIERAYKMKKIGLRKRFPKEAKSAAIVVGIVLLSLPAYSQVYKYKAYQQYFDYYDSDSIIESNWKDIDGLVVIDWTNNKIKLYAKNDIDFDLIQEREKGMDSIGRHFTFRAIDDRGTECQLMVYYYNDREAKNTAGIKIIYPKFGMYLRLKND